MIEKYLEKFNKYLVNGEYVFDANAKELKLDGKKGIETFSKKYTNGGKNENYIISGKEKIFKGNILLITSNDCGVKIFNDTKVLSYFYNKSEKERILVNKEKISKIFRVNDIIFEDDNYIIERRLACLSYDKLDGLYFIFKSYINYFNDINEKITKDFKCLQHCDLWSGNLIFDEKFYLIDFENVEIEYFLYDIFMYIYSEFYINNDKTLLVQYFKGYFDEYLRKYFDSLNIKYNKNRRVHYFNEFASTFLKNKFFKYSKYRRFKQFIKIHINKFIVIIDAKK